MRAPALALALLALAVTAPPAAAETISLPGAGLTIERPDGWQQRSIEENLAGLDRAGYGSGELRARMRDETVGVPFVLLVKNTRVYPTMSPVVRVQVRPGGEMSDLTLVQILRAVFTLTARAAPDARIEEEPAESPRFGPDGASMRLAYTFRVGESIVPIRSQMWMVRRGDFLFSFSITMAEGEVDSLWSEAESILDSVRIASPGA